MTISVIVPSCKRPESLRRLLADLRVQDVEAHWELLVVVPPDDTDTLDVLRETRMPVTVKQLVEPAAGKSRALNVALDQAQGELLVFTDDDVRVPRLWLAAYSHAADSYPAGRIFGGPVIPSFGPLEPDWLGQTHYAPLAFARFTPSLEAGPLPPALTPWGLNFAVRASAVQGRRFCEDLGPSSPEQLACDDVAFIRQVASEADHVIFVPLAGVTHHLQRDAASFGFQFERAFHLGRSSVRLSGHLDVPPLHRPFWSPNLTARYFDDGFILNCLCGQLYELDRQGARFQARIVQLLIATFAPIDDPGLLSASMARWLRSRPDLVFAGSPVAQG